MDSEMGMIEPKSAVLLIYSDDPEDECALDRAFVFDSHLDAFDTAEHYQKAGYYYVMTAFEHIGVGQAVEDLPPVQMRLEITERDIVPPDEQSKS